jgi:hypothetical protein
MCPATLRVRNASERVIKGLLPPIPVTPVKRVAHPRAVGSVIISKSYLGLFLCRQQGCLFLSTCRHDQVG